MNEQLAVPEYRAPTHALCRWCEKPVFLGDRSVYIHHGVLGQGRKSGQPIVVDDDTTSGDAVMHELCSLAYLTSMVVDSSDEVEAVIDTITGDMLGVTYSELLTQEQYCAACEAQLDGDED